MTVWRRLEIASRERALCVKMNRWGAHHVLTRLFRIVSRLGDGAFWYCLIGTMAALGGFRGQRAALHMACAGIVSGFLYRFLKRWTRRQRPYRMHADITAHIAPLDEFSFPSGHTLHAVGFTLIAVTYFPWLAPLLVPFAGLVAMSRVVLGLHYPSDVLAAALIAFTLAGASLWFAPAGWLV